MAGARRNKGRAGITLLAAAAVLGTAGTADAASLRVTTTSDLGSGPADTGQCLTGGTCSLRQAFAAAELDNSRITLPAGTYTLTQGQLRSQRPARFSPLTQLVGGGAATTRITQTTPGGGRLLHVVDGQLEVYGVAFSGGSVHGADGADGADAGGSEPVGDGEPGAAAHGGAIWNEGYLILSDVVVHDNEVVGGDGGAGGDEAAGRGGDGGAGGEASGGAIWTSGGQGVAMQQSRLLDNRVRAGEGGASGAGARADAKPGDGGDAFGGAVDLSTLFSTLDGTISGNEAVAGRAGAQHPAMAGGPLGAAGSAYGGGIANRGRVIDVWSSTVSGNVATGGAGRGIGRSGAAYGGGLYTAAVALVERSTFAGNTARSGSAALPGGRRGAAQGGGIAAIVPVSRSTWDVSLSASTIVRNTAETADASGRPAGRGGNLHVDGAVEALTSIVGEGSGATGAENCSAPLLSTGFNVEDDAAAQCGFGAPGDRSGAALDLGPLGDHGGLTPTVGLLSGSAAIDAGSCAPLVSAARRTDQRGAPRPIGAGCDAGAFEYGSDAPAAIPPIEPWDSTPVEVLPVESAPPRPEDVGVGDEQSGTPAEVLGGQRPSAATARTQTLPWLRFRLARPAVVRVTVAGVSGRGARVRGTVVLGRRGGGAQRVALPAKVRGRALAAGRYRVIVAARAGGRTRVVLRTSVVVGRR